MPTLGAASNSRAYRSDGTFMSSGPFQAPFWAVYGEFGDLDGISRHGSFAGTGLMWVYAFVSEILLVNLLIAMMTETYTQIRKNATHEFRFQRILIIDEFMGTVYHIPPPLSLPFLIMHLAKAIPQWVLWRIHGKTNRSYPRPKPDEHMEDLLTFKLPRKHMHVGWRKDLLVLQQMFDEREKKKAGSNERLLLEEQKRMHAELLMTQEVTFRLNEKMNDLKTQIGPSRRNGRIHCGVEQRDQRKKRWLAGLEPLSSVYQ